MALYKSPGKGVKRGTSFSKSKQPAKSYAWQDMKPLSTGGGVPMPPVGPPSSGGQTPAMKAYNAAHQTEWDAANHQARMQMRRDRAQALGLPAPGPNPKKRKKTAKKGPSSIKRPGGGIKAL